MRDGFFLRRLLRHCLLLLVVGLLRRLLLIVGLLRLLRGRLLLSLLCRCLLLSCLLALLLLLHDLRGRLLPIVVVAAADQREARRPDTGPRTAAQQRTPRHTLARQSGPIGSFAHDVSLSSVLRRTVSLEPRPPMLHPALFVVRLRYSSRG